MTKLNWSANVALAGCIGLIAACAPVDQEATTASLQAIEPAAAPPDRRIDHVAANDLFPPNPVPGHCYARVLLPATYDVSEEKLLIKEAEQAIEIDEAKYEWGEELVLVKEASTRIETIPAEYETVTERVLVKPAGRELVTIPAKYEITTERVLDKPAHTVWKRSSGPIDNALKTTYDERTGEVMCLVEVPATYRTIEKRTLIAPASSKEVITPAQYKTVKKRVLKTPAQTREIHIPAEYKTIKVQKLVQPARERRVKIPAQYETVTKRTKVSDELLVWREVLCEINMTDSVIRSIQEQLGQSGDYDGRVDGLFGPKTLRAVNSYAKARNLPVGINYIAIDTAKALGVES